MGRPVRADQDRRGQRSNQLSTVDRDGAISAVPLRRPGRLIAAVVMVAVLALFVYGAATNDNYQWATYRQYIFDQRIQFSGSDGSSYVLQTSSDLIHWNSESTNSPMQDHFSAPSSPSSNSQVQFYRSLLLP